MPNAGTCSPAGSFTVLMPATVSIIASSPLEIRGGTTFERRVEKPFSTPRPQERLTLLRPRKFRRSKAGEETMSPGAESERKRTERARKLMDRLAGSVGHFLVDAFHYLALFAIGGAIVWSALNAFWGMAVKGGASIDDILLLFIYLELGAM